MDTKLILQHGGDSKETILHGNPKYPAIEPFNPHSQEHSAIKIYDIKKEGLVINLEDTEYKTSILLKPEETHEDLIRKILGTHMTQILEDKDEEIARLHYMLMDTMMQVDNQHSGNRDLALEKLEDAAEEAEHLKNIAIQENRILKEKLSKRLSHLIKELEG